MKKINKEKGFSLIELMVSMSIMVFVFLLSVPSYSSWMAKMRVRNTVESVNLGIIQARSEAIRRNTLVTFQMDPDTSWQIIDTSTGKILNKKTNQESSQNIYVSIIPERSDSVTFNGFGLLTDNPDGSPSFQIVSTSSSMHAAIATQLNVVIGSGGSSIVCDPLVSSTTDFRYCRAQ